MKRTQTFLLAILAGILIGIGVIINTSLSVPVLGALLFSFGLLSIIELKLPLYTGKIGFAGQQKFYFVEMLLGNFVGAGGAVGAYTLANPKFETILTLEKAAIKFSKSPFELFLLGVICGILVHFAVKIKKWYTTIMAIMIFILIGAEHCVADFPYFLMAIASFDNLLKFLMIILGNSLGAIGVELILNKYGESICSDTRE